MGRGGVVVCVLVSERAGLGVVLCDDDDDDGLTWSRVPVHPIIEYLRARQHWPIWWMKPRAAMRWYFSLGGGVVDGGGCMDMSGGSGFLSASMTPGLTISILLPGKELAVISEDRLVLDICGLCVV